MAIDDRTAHLSLPLPNATNTLLDDVVRLREALNSIDAALFTKQTAAEVSASVTAAINALVAGAPAALDTLDELAAALADDANFAASVTTALAGKSAVGHVHTIANITGLQTALDAKLASLPVASSVTLGGVKVGSGLSIDGAGVLSATGAGVSNTFTELSITPASNGQTVFTPAGGYTVGQIELFLNGVLLYGGGDDYTAANGTAFTLTVGANTTDTLLLRKWSVVAVSGMVQKTGDTMTGALNQAHGADIASASTINLTTATGNLVDVTGTTTITVITLSDGAERTVRFTGALALTNGTSLVLPGGANITTAAGDFAVFRGYAAGVVRCTGYTKASGLPVVAGGGSGTGTGTLTDIKASRAASTTYTNSGAATRWVLVTGNCSPSVWASVVATVGGVERAYNATTSGASGSTLPVTFPVPPGATYSIAINNCTIFHWHEFQ